MQRNLIMKKNSKRRRSGKRKRGVENLAGRIEKRVQKLKQDIDDFREATERADNRGCTREELHAIEFAYLSTPLNLLLLTAITIIDTIPEESEINRDSVAEIVDAHTVIDRPSYQLGEDLVNLLQKCYDYIGKELFHPRTDGAERTRAVH